MQKLIECIPNFSEGQRPDIIQQIADSIRSVAKVKLLNIDAGKAANRTVITFAGTPGEVVEAAFNAIKKASELIDMSKQKGEHPRIGATDVCPLVPLNNISMGETVEYARKLAKRVGEELEIPVYCYEYAAFSEQRHNLASCRKGEYEGLGKKLKLSEWKPDFGPRLFNPKTGATVIGARKFLIAYNVNLNTSSVEIANKIAAKVRESGQLKKAEKGKPVRNESGKPIRIPGTLKKTKAIGWYIKEYGKAQVSMNLTDISVTSLHHAYDEVKKQAELHGVKVTGSELIGLVPLQAMLGAGKHYLNQHKPAKSYSEQEIIDAAIKSLGLAELQAFIPGQRIIEYLL